MSDYLKYLKRFGIPKGLTLANHRACLWLERHGYRFYVDFGYTNAAAQAKAERERMKPVTR